MSLFFADGINIPIVLVGGIVVLAPLMAFEVFVEAFVLKKVWGLPYRQLCRLTFFANCWSLVAGIPTKILNAFLLSPLLPQDIPGFFARYPFVAATGSLIYFAVTVLVEGMCAFRWRKREQLKFSRGQIWRGMLLANLVTYAVLSPFYYFATKPPTDIHTFSNDTRWTSHAATTVLFIGASDQYLKSVQADGSGAKTIVPVPMEDYMISTNLNVCLFRGTNGNLYLYRRDVGQTSLIWNTNERFYMDQVAFSPSGQWVAFATAKGGFIQVMEVATEKRTSLPLGSNYNFDYEGPYVAWSPDESKLFVGDSHAGSRQKVTIEADGMAALSSLEGTNTPPVLKCYQRSGDVHWGSGGDWGESRSRNECGDLKAWSESGLISGLSISRELGKTNTRVLSVSVSPGMLHLAGFDFGDVEFLEGCGECLFEANGYIYVLDINEKRLGTLAQGDRFIQLTQRDEKGL